MAQELNIKELVRKTRERKKFLDAIIEPVIKLVREKGRMINRSQETSHTNVVWELRNFGGFSFHTDLGQTMFGGNTVKVFYHPSRSFREGGLDSAHDKDWVPVLDVYFQTELEYRVSKFDERLSWQRKLFWVLRNKDKVAARAEKENRKRRDVSRRELRQIEKREDTINDAKRLGIISQ